MLPGGWCPDYLRRDKRFVDLVRNMVAASKFLCSVYFDMLLNIRFSEVVVLLEEVRLSCVDGG